MMFWLLTDMYDHGAATSTSQAGANEPRAKKHTHLLESSTPSRWNDDGK